MRSKKLDGDNIIDFDAGIYSEQAVKSAIYDLDIIAHISKNDNNTKIIQVKILASNDTISTLRQKIFKTVLDHQIRIDVEKESGTLKKLILAQAFFPCDNLDQLLDEIDF